jgi:hypothetical protein
MKTGGLGKIVQAEPENEADKSQGHPGQAEGQPEDEKIIEIGGTTNRCSGGILKRMNTCTRMKRIKRMIFFSSSLIGLFCG